MKNNTTGGNAGAVTAYSAAARCAIRFGAVFSVLVLSGCGFWPWGGDDGDRDPLNNSAPREEKLKTDISLEDARKLAKPPESGDGINVNPPSLEVGGSLQPVKGLNTKPLFSERISDDDERFERLEKAVQDIRNDFDKIAPSVNRLVAVEKDMQELTVQLSSLLQSEGVAVPVTDIRPEQLNNDPAAIAAAMGTTPPASNAPMDLTAGLQKDTPALAPSTPAPSPVPAPPPAPPLPAAAMAKPAPVNSSPSSVTNIRIADVAGKTRIVIESNTKLSYSEDLDNGEKILTLTFTNGNPGSFMDSRPAGSRLVQSYSATPQGDNGFILAFVLNKSSSIIGKGAIAPNADNPNHRIFIDLKR